MPLHPSNTLSRERILSFGAAGMGKSTDFWMVARRSIMSGSDAIFYVIDTDVSAGRALSDPNLSDHLLETDEDGDLRPVSNVVIKPATDWVSLVGAFESISLRMRVQDWVMIDMITPTWNWAQKYYIKQVHRKDKSDLFLAHRTANANGSAPPKLDWSTITSLYDDDVLTPLLNCKGHIYATAEAKALDGDTAEKDTKLLLQPFGVVPAGQKRLAHVFQTVLLKRATKQGEWKMTSVKDRGRVQHTDTVVKDFSIDYLVRSAGWKLS